MRKQLSVLCMVSTLLIANLANAGPIDGGQSARDEVQPFSTVKYHIKLRGQESYKIVVKGDGTSDLDCYLVDLNGKLVNTDDGPTDHCKMVGTPEETANFTLKIINRGKTVNHFSLDID